MAAFKSDVGRICNIDFYYFCSFNLGLKEEVGVDQSGCDLNVSKNDLFLPFPQGLVYFYS